MGRAWARGLGRSSTLPCTDLGPVPPAAGPQGLLTPWLLPWETTVTLRVDVRVQGGGAQTQAPRRVCYCDFAIIALELKR